MSRYILLTGTARCSLRIQTKSTAPDPARCKETRRARARARAVCRAGLQKIARPRTRLESPSLPLPRPRPVVCCAQGCMWERPHYIWIAARAPPRTVVTLQHARRTIQLSIDNDAS